MMSHGRNGTNRVTASERWCHIRLRLAPDSVIKSLAALLFLSVVAVLFTNACSSSSPGTTPTPPPSGAPPLSSPTAGVPTAGQLASAGQTVFANSCRCHGDKGQGVTGPAIIGANASLGKYSTAQRLLDFIDTAMPRNAPGSLSQQQYQQVLCFLLVQNQLVKAESAFQPDQLRNIPLK